METKRQFLHSFGPGAVARGECVVPKGSPVDWHEANRRYYVRPSAVEPYFQHDATYRGIPVDPDNIEGGR